MAPGTTVREFPTARILMYTRTLGSVAHKAVSSLLSPANEYKTLFYWLSGDCLEIMSPTKNC